MNKLLTTTAVALLLGVAPALAAEDSGISNDSAQPQASQSSESSALPSDTDTTPEASQPDQPHAAMDSSQEGQLPTTSTVSPETAKEAKVPDEGSPDTSGGAMERSSAPPQSGAVIDNSGADSSTE